MSEEIEIKAFDDAYLILRDSDITYNNEQVVVEIVPFFGKSGHIELSGQAALALANQLMERATIRHVVDEDDNVLCKMLDGVGLVRDISTERGPGPLCQACKKVVKEEWLV